MVERKRKVFTFPRDTCSSEAKTRSRWTPTCPQLDPFDALKRNLNMLCDHFSVLEVSPPLTYSDFHWLQERNKLACPLSPRIFIQEFKHHLKFSRRSWLALSLSIVVVASSPEGMFVGSRHQGATARLLQWTLASSWCLRSGSERRWELRCTTSSPAASACYAPLLRWAARKYDVVEILFHVLQLIQKWLKVTAAHAAG